MNAAQIALERCKKLFSLARGELERNPTRAKRYVKLARKVAMRHRLPLGSKEFCKKCGAVFVLGKSLKVRSSSKQKMMLYTCLACGAVKKFGYSRERKAARKNK